MICIEEYLQSGVVEDYCLGIASPQEVAQLMQYCERFPQVNAYLEQTQKALESYLKTYHRKPSSRSKEIIINAILENQKLDRALLSGENRMLNEFIGISRNTNIESWEAITRDLHPPDAFENIYAKPLYVSEREELILIWAKGLVPDEVHHDIEECFLVFEGTVDCYVEDQVFSMKRGDFMQIPLYTHHKVVVTSATPVKAIRSRVLVG